MDGDFKKEYNATAGDMSDGIFRQHLPSTNYIITIGFKGIDGNEYSAVLIVVATSEEQAVGFAISQFKNKYGEMEILFASVFPFYLNNPFTTVTLNPFI